MKIAPSRSLLCWGLMLCCCAVQQVFAEQALKLPPPLPVSPDRAELGKQLFFDTRLSGDAELACASCHMPSRGFSDGLALSRAYTGMEGFRNSPTLINTAWRKVWLHDGRIGTNLNDVTREMLTESWLMNMDMRLMQERLKQIPAYVELFAKAGLGEPSNGGVRKAIPEFLKTLRSQNVPFDQDQLSDQAKEGERLFFGKAGCAQCHSGPLFSDQQAHNLGVPENPDIFVNVDRHVAYVTFTKFMGLPEPMTLRQDVGAFILSPKPNSEALGAFITPTLRELKYTAPYMHNGMLASLDEVVAFYNAGGGQAANKDSKLKPLGLSASEQEALVAFLEALSGDPLSPAGGWPNLGGGLDEYPIIESWREVSN